MDELIISIFYDINNFCEELKNYYDYLCLFPSVGIPVIQIVLHKAHTEGVSQVFLKSG